MDKSQKMPLRHHDTKVHKADLRFTKFWAYVKTCGGMLNPFGVRGGAAAPAPIGFTVPIGSTYGYSCSTTSWLAGRSIGSAWEPIGFTYGYSRSTTSWLQVTRKKMPGFTLMEQIVVLALTTILVLIGFTAILNFQRLLMNVRENAGKDRSVYLFRNVLEDDFRSSETIGWDGGLNIVKEEGTVRYQFEKLCVIRETAEAVDTFRFAASDVVISGVNGNKTLVEAISFKLSDDIQFYKMSFLKKYPDYKIWEVSAYGN